MNKFISFFKDNKEIIVLIPTLFGGLYQLLNILILVGLPYVRYFSVSQVIPDGLLISVVSVSIYITFKIISKLYESTKENYNNQIQHTLFFNITYIAIMCSIGIYSFYSSLMLNDYSSLALILMRYLCYAGAILFFWIGLKHFLIITGLSDILINKFNSLSRDSKVFLISITVILFISIIIRIAPIEISLINQSFIKVNNFENYTSFSHLVQKSYSLKYEPELLYINKDYAFFKIKGDRSKILVVDAKSLTEIPTK